MAKNTKEVEIRFEGEQWTNALDKAFEKKNKNVTIDGFRKGAAPKKVYLEKYGLQSLFIDAANELVPIAYEKAIKDSKIEPVVEPGIDIKDIDDNHITFTITLIGRPEIKLGAYTKLGVKKEKVSVTQKEVEEEINKMRDQYAEIQTKEGKAKLGDTVNIDYTGYMDGVAFEGGEGKNFPLELGSHTFIPGFEEGVVGMAAKDEKDIDLTFPENYPNGMANKKATFHVVVNEVKERILPELNEDFFADLNNEKITSKETLEAEVKNTLTERKQAEVDDKFLNEVLEKAISNMEVDIPHELVHEEVHRVLDEYEQRLKMQGISLAQFAELSGKTIASLEEEMEPEATNRIKMRYLIEEIAKKEKIEVTDKEADKDAEEMAKNYGISKEELIKAYGSLDVLKYDSKMRKTLNFVKDNN